MKGAFLMAKTMFSDKIIASDIFLDMPLSAQALYMHLSMNADNDGFVQPRKIMRMIGAANDDLQILIAKRFVLVFENGVAVIKHWWLNNTKRGDRHTPTTYCDELELLITKANKSYTLRAEKDEKITEVGNQLATNWQPTAANLAPQSNTKQYKAIQLNSTQLNTKNATRKVAEVEKISTKEIDGMFEYWQSNVGYEVTSKIKQNRLYCSKLLKEYSKQDIARMIKAAALASEDQYAPSVSDFIDLHRKWDRLKLWGKKKSVSIQSGVVE